MPDPMVTWIAKMLGVSIARKLLAVAPSRIVRRWYPDAKVAEEIRIRPLLEHEGLTIRFEVHYGIPRLRVQLVVENHSLYRAVRVDRVVGLIDGFVDLAYEGWASENPPERINAVIVLTSEQAAHLKEITTAVEVKGVAQVICDGRAISKVIRVTGKVHATP